MSTAPANKVQHLHTTSLDMLYFIMITESDVLYLVIGHILVSLGTSFRIS